MVDAAGLPIRYNLSPGQAHDSTAAGALLADLPPDSFLLADKPYDAEWIRARPSADHAGPSLRHADAGEETLPERNQDYTWFKLKVSLHRPRRGAPGPARPRLSMAENARVNVPLRRTVLRQDGGAHRGASVDRKSVDKQVRNAPVERMSGNSTPPSEKRSARFRMTVTVRTVDALQPEEKSYTAWDDKLTGFGVRVQPSGLRSYLVNYRAGDRGRKAPNRRIVIGRHGLVTLDQARRRAREILGRVALGATRSPSAPADAPCPPCARP